MFFGLGEFELRPGAFVRVEDTGTESITFANMRFRFVAPVPTLGISSSLGMRVFRWPTNASAYRLECVGGVDGSAGWSSSVLDAPVSEGDSFTLSLPIADERKYFRLVQP